MNKATDKSIAEKTRALVQALKKPAAYDHPVSTISIIETHISWIILTGQIAYKIKKPVNFGFLDFSSLVKREHFCEQELRLNRRFSADIYLEVASIRGSHDNPNLGGKGRIIEYAVKMKQFPQSLLLSNIATEHQLSREHIDSMADVIAEFHINAPSAATTSSSGSPQSIGKWTAENFSHLDNLITEHQRPDDYNNIKSWCLRQSTALTPLLQERKNDGYIRECHGDLHLGNMAFIDNHCTPFDCIEFNDELSWIDIMSEVAFIVMDLLARGYTRFAWRFFNQYLQTVGDYSGLAVFRYYLVYRALVRAKVELLSANQHCQDNNTPALDLQHCFHYLDIARTAIESRQPAIILMHGLSGSGKSTQAQTIAESLGAIQLRSDIERKRLFKLDKLDASGSTVESGIYTREAAEQTYQKLCDIAEGLLKEGYCVIIDAAFLKTWQRRVFLKLAKKTQLPCLMVSCQVDESILRERICRRMTLHNDPSEANLEVLDQQLKAQQRIAEKEFDKDTLFICDHRLIGEKQVESIRRVIVKS